MTRPKTKSSHSGKPALPRRAPETSWEKAIAMATALIYIANIVGRSGRHKELLSFDAQLRGRGWGRRMKHVGDFSRYIDTMKITVRAVVHKTKDNEEVWEDTGCDLRAVSHSLTQFCLIQLSDPLHKSRGTNSELTVSKTMMWRRDGDMIKISSCGHVAC